MGEETSNPIRFEIIEEISTLSESGKWKTQLNIVQWGDNIAKYDIRAWNQDHTKSSKGNLISIIK